MFSLHDAGITTLERRVTVQMTKRDTSSGLGEYHVADTIFSFNQVWELD